MGVHPVKTGLRSTVSGQGGARQNTAGTPVNDGRSYIVGLWIVRAWDRKVVLIIVCILMQVTYVTYCSVSSLYATTCTFTRARACAPGCWADSTVRYDASRYRRKDDKRDERRRERRERSSPYAEPTGRGHRCPTPQTTSLYPALNPNQLASVSLNIFPHVYVAMCTWRAFDVLLAAASIHFLKLSWIIDGHGWCRIRYFKRNIGS